MSPKSLAKIPDSQTPNLPNLDPLIPPILKPEATAQSRSGLGRVFDHFGTVTGLDWKEFCKIKNDACGVKEEGAKGNDVGEFVGDANKYVKFMFDRQEKVSK